MVFTIIIGIIFLDYIVLHVLCFKLYKINQRLNWLTAISLAGPIYFSIP